MTASLNLNPFSWAKHLADMPMSCQDVYFTPEYHRIHSANGDGEPYGVYISKGDASLLIPGLRVPIASPLGARSACWDIQTCNGYGGPLASPQADREFLNSAWGEWRRSSASEGIVAAFFRLHPLLGNECWLPDDAGVVLDRQTASVDLVDGLDAAWERADSRHRNMVNKGRREGLVVCWDDPAGWGDFESLYRESMERLNAPSALRFSTAYFKGLSQLPGVHLASVRCGSQLVAAAVFMFGALWGHYHLSARREGTGNHLTNCILQAGMERAAAVGLEGLHLGGGRTRIADDGLLKFKLSLGGKLLDFKVAMVITNPEAYEELCAAWTQAAGHKPQWLLGYRQPMPVLVGI